MPIELKPKTYKKRLMATVASQGAAYGFTLTVWGSGALAAAIYGAFTIPRVIAYISGPLVMYALLLVVLYRPGQPVVKLADIRFSAFGFLDFLSVPAALITAFLIYEAIPEPMIGLPVGSFLATLVYNLMLATQISLVIIKEVKEEVEVQNRMLDGEGIGPEEKL